MLVEVALVILVTLPKMDPVQGRSMLEVAADEGLPAASSVERKFQNLETNSQQCFLQINERTRTCLLYIPARKNKFSIVGGTRFFVLDNDEKVNVKEQTCQ